MVITWFRVKYFKSVGRMYEKIAVRLLIPQPTIENLKEEKLNLT